MQKRQFKQTPARPTAPPPPLIPQTPPVAAPNPQDINALIALFGQQRYPETEALARSLTEHCPDHGFGWKALGATLKQMGRGKEALMPFQMAAALLPREADVSYNLGNAYLEHGRLENAEASYRRALAIDAGFLPAHFSLGQVLQAQERFSEAETSYRTALRINPDMAEAHSNLGVSLMELGRMAEAETHYRRALALRPQFAEAHNNLGIALKEQGLLEQACLSFEAAIALKPHFILAHYSLSTLKTYHEGEPHLGFLEQQLDRVDDLPMPARIRYWFTLGKVREDLGRYDQSFAAYQEGNRLQHALLPVDEAKEEALAERIMAVFSKEFFAARPQSLPPSSHAGKAPILIVGMPRSGTSLLEQILASCPGVHGAGEVPTLPDAVTAAMPGAVFECFPDAVAAFTTEDFARLAAQYVEGLASHAPDATHIVDKMLSNFLFIGMIHQMLPNAKIIHAMRDPMDSCFSSYTCLFNQRNLNFTYDLGTLGRCYARYARLMRHWHAVLPPGTILDVHYEDMVADTEVQARRLLTYLDMPWEAQCLNFHQNQRKVNTVSAAQVRKPIYQTSVARWKRYEGHLEELRESVKGYELPAK